MILKNKKNWVSRQKSMLGVLILISLIVFFPLVFAHVEADEKIHALAQDVIFGKTIDCTTLSQDEMESLGDELMESMMGSELHEIMDLRMGASENVMHLMMGRTIGCGDNVLFGNNMMSMMMNMARGGRMGMMDFGYGTGMMGYGTSWGLGLLYWIIALGLAVLVWLWAIKLWRDLSGPGKGKR